MYEFFSFSLYLKERHEIGMNKRLSCLLPRSSVRVAWYGGAQASGTAALLYCRLQADQTETGPDRLVGECWIMLCLPPQAWQTIMVSRIRNLVFSVQMA